MDDGRWTMDDGRWTMTSIVHRPSSIVFPLLPRRWDNAKLLHHTQLVKVDPVLYELPAAADAQHIHPLYRELLAGRGHAQEFSALCAAQGKASDDFVSLCDNIFSVDTQVGESA